MVAAELGYERPSGRVADPGTERGTIGFVLPDLNNPTFSSLLKAAQQRLNSRGCDVMVADSERDPYAEAELVRAMAPKLDGLVVCSPLSEPSFLASIGRGLPVLLVDGQVPGLSSLTLEYADGMRQAVGHLAALGHRKLAYAGGRVTTWPEQQRRLGLAQAVDKLKLPAFVDLGHFVAEIGGGYAAADLLLSSEATAIVCVNTFVALGLINRLGQRGVRVPEQVSVIEFDAATTNQLVSPMLTTVAPSQGAMGSAVADIIVRMVRAESRQVEESIPVELSVQQSTSVLLADMGAEVLTRRSR